MPLKSLSSTFLFSYDEENFCGLFRIMGTSLMLGGFKLHFGAFLNDIEPKNMFLLANSFWVSLWDYIVPVFGFIFRSFLSLSGKNSAEIGSDFEGVLGKPDEGIGENENEEVGIGENENGSVSSASTSKYQLFPVNSLCAFIEKPQTISYTVQEIFVISNDESPNREDFLEDHEPPKNDFPGISVDSVDVSFSDDVTVNPDSSTHADSDNGELIGGEIVVKQGKTEDSVFALNSKEEEALSFTEISNVEERERILSEHEFSNEVRSSVSNSDDFWSSIHKYNDFLDSNHVSDSDSEEMLCGKSPREAFEPETPMGIGDKRVDFDEDSPRSSDDFSLVQNSLHSEEHISMDEFSDSDDEFDQESSGFDDSKGIDASESCDGGDDQTGRDVFLEQKELIRQMKKEIRHLKISGLPTILEESESTRVDGDFRPLKIDGRIGHKDHIYEIQILYKKYLDKMRKLDSLSQQTMYAIGLLNLKNNDQFASNKKASVPVIKSLLAQNLWSYKLKKHDTDSDQRLIRDFQRDLELVYIGQLCLSWEILKWQHHKVKELHGYDPDGFRQYSQVAGEFQKFQVLVQRFTEDEPFHHGPRVQHYVKSRCSLSSLLQVPLIKDDPRVEWRGKGEAGISIGMLKEVIGASMCAFWEFLHADKDEFNARTLIGIHGVHVDLQCPSDTELLTEVRSNLQKKEKRLKDLVRSGNCIVRKFQKHQDRRLSQEMFLAQVELRFVSRVLNMSRLTTDQLLWCHKKLSKINFVGRKVYLDSSFLFFPC